MVPRHGSPRGGLAGLTLALVLAANSVCPRPASAAVDLDGLWRVGIFVTQFSLTFTDVCSLTIVQSGTTLSITGPCQGMGNPVAVTGTIDPATGGFAGSGSAGICPAITIDGTGIADSRTFAGRFSCPQFQATGGVNGSRCGNGQIDAAETCDDGNLVNGDCCSASCQLAANGARCSDDGSLCTSDTCDATGQCQHVTLSGPCDDGSSCTGGDTCVDGQCIGAVRRDDAPCDDGNACTTGDKCLGGTCTAEPVVCPACLSCTTALGCVPTIDNACKQSAVTSIVLKSAGTQAVVWKWRNGDATQLVDLGDPTATTDYDFCIYDANVDQDGSPGLLLSARAPAGEKWHRRAAGFGYRSQNLTPDGLKGIRLKAGAAGAAQALVAGRGPNLDLPPLQSIVMPMTVQLKSRNGWSSQCWSAEYGSPAVSGPLLFKAGMAIPRPDTRPNILLIDLDDTRADGIDQMPTVLSRLAAQGVSFPNSFVVDSLCAPSRASLLTGLFGRHHGVEALNGVIGGEHIFRERGTDRQTIAVWLQRAGYMTGLFGKYINGYGLLMEDTLGPGGRYYVPPGWTRWRGMTSPEHYGGIQGGTYRLVNEHGGRTVYDDHTADHQYSTDLLAGEVRTFIADAVSQNRPFFAVWTPYASHAETRSLTPEPAARHVNFFRGMPAWRPASFDEMDVTDKPRWVQGLRPGNFSSLILNGLARQHAYETLLAVDEDLGVILDDLVQLGIDQNTVLVFTSDNGVGWGEHRLFAQVKECPYEECVRVPMIVRDPRAGSTAIVRDATVLNVDIAPTVAALAGVVPPVPTDGVSFAPWVVGPPPAQWRDDFLLEYRRSDRNDQLSYKGQVTDGDQLRLLSGNSRAQPRASALFEFDDGSGVTGSAIAVPLGVDADGTFSNLGDAVVAAVPSAAKVHLPGIDALVILDNSPDHDGVYWLVERDRGAVIQHTYPLPDYFGVRDVTNGFTYVEYASGETELYDLTADPAELENKAGDPTYAATRERLSQHLNELLK